MSCLEFPNLHFQKQACWLALIICVLTQWPVNVGMFIPPELHLVHVKQEAQAGERQR